MNESQIRTQQIEAGRRQVMADKDSASGPVSYTSRPKSNYAKPASSKPSAPKGHEAFLKALETSGATVSFEKASSGAVTTGVIKHSDKYTVSVITADSTRVLFKHDISEFWAITPRATEAA